MSPWTVNDRAEVCEMVGLFILNGLSNEYWKESIGLYRDDRIVIFENISRPKQLIRKHITRHFKNHRLKITIQTNLKIVTFNLTNGSYYLYRKPNNLPQYINIKSYHTPNIIKQLPTSINRRISDNSFNKAKPIYDDAPKSSGYTDILNDQGTIERKTSGTTCHSAKA